ncbi:uncharacterized protein Z520_02772 [Fonsecaea multimorphosa CBS 102226]|uniref:PEBP-like protein n=1 Tax=Fonsecaea multimorphosa CBS 102226 TaxID=1442371 RepID=A0A0D2KDC8_9EURO|nr:uncharacterized protein Z520_02772 [Fonsecaea multimorphosa CBS 102226]KIY01220.1 hypothetical protein Z520_02772 [Fonsecaea multimorphosa CBS 102226]
MKLSPYSSALVLLVSYYGRLTSCQTPPGFSPSTNKALYVSFDNVEITPGKRYPLDDTAVSPSIAFPGCGPPQDTHLVLMVDLDAPDGAANNRSLAPLLHWLQQSIPARLPAISSNYSVAAAAPIAPYAMPQPPPGSGLHRYVILAFDQPQKTFSVPANFSQFNNENRFNFDVAEFAEEAKLTVAGATWFVTQNTTQA